MSIDRNQKEEDLIVELEDVIDDGLPQIDEDVEEPELRTPEAPTTPDAEDNDWDEEDDVEEPVARGKEVAEEVVDDRDERYVAAQREHNIERSELMWQRTLAQVEKIAQDRALTDYAINETNGKIEAAYAQLAAAKEAGDTQSEIQAQRYLDELKGFRGQMETVRGQLPDPEAVKRKGYDDAIAVRNANVEPVSQGVAVGANLRARNPLAAEWAKANASWMKDNAAANDFIVRQSKQMTESGDYSPNDRGFYAELSRRVQSKFPNLKVARPNASRQQAPQRKMAAVVSSKPSSGAGTQRQSAGVTRFKLDRAAQSKMRMFNLDPANPEHRKSYAETVLKRQRREAAQGAR